MKIKVRKPRFMSVLLVACLAGCSLLTCVFDFV